MCRQFRFWPLDAGIDNREIVNSDADAFDQLRGADADRQTLVMFCQSGLRSGGGFHHWHGCRGRTRPPRPRRPAPRRSTWRRTSNISPQAQKWTRPLRGEVFLVVSGALRQPQVASSSDSTFPPAPMPATPASPARDTESKLTNTQCNSVRYTAGRQHNRYGQPRRTVRQAPIMAKMSNGVYVKNTPQKTIWLPASCGSLGQRFHIRRNLMPASCTTSARILASLQASEASRIRRSSRCSSGISSSDGPFFGFKTLDEIHVARAGGLGTQPVVQNWRRPGAWWARSGR